MLKPKVLVVGTATVEPAPSTSIGCHSPLLKRQAHLPELLAQEEARRAEEAAAGVPKLEPFNEFR
jgi:hypothetical protein